MQKFDLVTCRRTNYIQAAMVQAAISIQHAHGTPVAIAMLRAEQLSEDVISRVLSAGTSKRQSPYSALEQRTWPPSDR